MRCVLFEVRSLDVSQPQSDSLRVYINPRGQENSEKTDWKIISLEKVESSALVLGTQNKVQQVFLKA
jgi:hypothetical protein